jgi:hypothetical protein
MRPEYNNKSCLLAAGFLCFSAVASAQQAPTTTAVTVVPRLVRFAGSFHSPVSQPAGPVGATFAIYAEQEGGTPLWSEDRNVELDASGNYTVLLGAASNEGVPVDLFTAGQARWLQVKFYTPGEVDLPRVLLVSVPYALKAGDADTLGGKPAAAYLLAGAPAAVQPASPSEPARTAPSPTATALLPSDIASTGTPNYIAMFTDASGDVGNSVIYQNGSNVGVGTSVGAISMDVRPTATSPYPQLGVAQTVDYMTLFASDTYGPAFYWDPTKALRFGKGGTALYSATGFVEYMRIQPNGYVGIGTQAPAAQLEVKGNAQVDGNLTLMGSILSPTNNVPVIQAPANGSDNFSAGLGALPPGTTGSQDTAIGDNALSANLTGGKDTGVGFGALASNTAGTSNTATGAGALEGNTTGSNNTASGALALGYNTTGGSNTATGAGALELNTIGSSNTANGASTLYYNTGDNNTANGAGALGNNTSGGNNTASGVNALANNTTGNNNTATGEYALLANSSGSNNIAIGYDAGVNIISTGNNIEIGNLGSASDSGAIRIGTTGNQTTAFIAGVQGVTTGSNDAVPVMIDSNGQLGTISSSRRYKEDIQDMGDSSSGLLHLRPVTFRYKMPFSDGSKPIQYGLIAEEVAAVYPDLVAHSADGQIETVKYQVLDSMLLNEVQKQNATIATQKELIRDQQLLVRDQGQQIRSLEERLTKLEAALEGGTVTTSSR